MKIIFFLIVVHSMLGSCTQRTADKQVFLKHLKEAETGKEGIAELKEDVDEFYTYFE